MCPMCEKRAQLLLQQQAVVESSSRSSSKPSGTDSYHPGKRSLFRNPFKACKHLTRQCCSPHCESLRTSLASGRRSSAIAPVPSTPEHSSELTYIISESPLSANSKGPEPPQEAAAGKWPRSRKSRRRRGLLTRLQKALTQAPHERPKAHHDVEPSSTESSFGACGRKVMAVADEVGELAKAPPTVMMMPSAATLLIAETDLDDSVSEFSIAVTETNVSGTTVLSMMNLNGSIDSAYDELTTSNRGSTLKSSAYDDDASSFAIVPRTSMNSSHVGRDGASDASAFSGRFGELDIGYLSLEDEFHHMLSISSDQSDPLDLEMHDAEDDTVSESDLDQEYSVSTDSQVWFTEPEDAASVLQRSRTHHNRGNNSNKQLTPPPLRHRPSEQENKVPPAPTTKINFESVVLNRKPLSVEKNLTTPRHGRRMEREATKTPGTEYLCSRCGRSEAGQQTKVNPMSSFFKTYMGEEEQAVMAAKVVVLLGKYGNRKGLRVSGLSTPQQQHQHQHPHQHQAMLSTRELERLRSMVCPSDDAVSAFQSEVATMMLEGVDVPELNMDVEQFIAGYMKLNSPFYIDLIQDFFKSVCIDCFGNMENVPATTTTTTTTRSAFPPRPAYAVLKPRKPKSLAGKGNNSARRLLH